jgi:hypothetical protein
MENDQVYTTEEVRAQFLEEVERIVQTWLSYKDQTKEETVHGAVFSILAAIDGSSMSLPPFILAPLTCRENQEYAKEEGSKYYLLNNIETMYNDIGGSLHDSFGAK